jgi:uncharacterized membrane protein YdjX (TVP38/TMEM64 family)
MTEPIHIMKTKKYILFLLLLIVVIASYLNDNLIEQYLLHNIERLKSIYGDAPLIFSLGYAATYIIFVTLSLPIALVMGLLAGVIFDPINAIIVVSFASSIGATTAMLLARYFAYSYVSDKYKNQIKIINSHLIDNEKYYLFALRMSPIFPFFIINICFGVTKIKAKVFYLISQLGMLPGTIIIILTGNEIEQSLSGDKIFTSELIIYLTMLGLLPIVFKFFNKKIYTS